MASSKTKTFEDLLKGLNVKLEVSSGRLATAATTASTKHTAYVGTMENFVKSVNEKLDAEKAEVSFSAKVAMEMHNSNIRAGETFASHQDSLSKVEDTLKDTASANDLLTGHVEAKFTEVGDYVA